MFDKSDWGLLISICAFILSAVAGVVAPIVDGCNRRKSDRRNGLAQEIRYFWQLTYSIIDGSANLLPDFLSTVWALEAHLQKRSSVAMLREFACQVEQFSKSTAKQKAEQKALLLSQMQETVTVLHREMY